MTAYVAFLMSLLFFLFLVCLAAIPAMIAFKKKHRNKWLIAVLTAISWLATPLAPIPSAILWIICLVFAMYTPPELKTVKGEKGDQGVPGMEGPTGPTGPMGPRGEPGVDAIPLSSKGFYNRREDY